MKKVTISIVEAIAYRYSFMQLYKYTEVFIKKILCVISHNYHKTAPSSTYVAYLNMNQ